MKIRWIITVGLLALGSVQAQELKQKQERVAKGEKAKGTKKARPVLYPFDVTIGGQTAQMQEGNMLFAIIEKPVKQDALLELAEVADMLIVNAFRVRENGAVMEPGQQPAIYFVKNNKQVKLDQTMDKKKLAPGRYLVNVVAHGKTSRVVFVVEDASGELKIPTVKQVFDFLTK